MSWRGVRGWQFWAKVGAPWFVRAWQEVRYIFFFLTADWQTETTTSGWMNGADLNDEQLLVVSYSY
jgi:hypothetical protein